MGSPNKILHLIKVNSMVATASGIVVDAEDYSHRLTLTDNKKNHFGLFIFSDLLGRT